MTTLIQMSGSEWFGSSRGGLNRYFTDLFGSLQSRPDVAVTATAFGDAPPGGDSWGPIAGSTLSRVRASRAPRPTDGVILDRHFAMYGPSTPLRRHHPVVTHFHGPWAAESAAAGSRAIGAKRAWEKLRYRQSELCIVLSSYTRDILSEDYGVPAERIEVIPPGVSLDSDEPVDEPNGDRPTVLCVRRLEHRMGIDVLLSAWPTVLDAVPDARLVIVGIGSQEADLRAQATESGIGDSVEFTGNASDDDLAALYRASTLTVIPTRDLEGFGLIALESLAAGRAPVVTDIGGLPESVRGFDDSLIVPSQNAPALADRLVRGLTGERPSAQLCRRRAEEFSWDRCAERHLAAYRTLL